MHRVSTRETVGIGASMTKRICLSSDTAMEVLENLPEEGRPTEPGAQDEPFTGHCGTSRCGQGLTTKGVVRFGVLSRSTSGTSTTTPTIPHTGGTAFITSRSESSARTRFLRPLQSPHRPIRQVRLRRRIETRRHQQCLLRLPRYGPRVPELAPQPQIRPPTPCSCNGERAGGQPDLTGQASLAPRSLQF